MKKDVITLKEVSAAKKEKKNMDNTAAVHDMIKNVSMVEKLIHTTVLLLLS